MYLGRNDAGELFINPGMLELKTIKTSHSGLVCAIDVFNGDMLVFSTIRPDFAFAHQHMGWCINSIQELSKYHNK
jgi:hypothetical protein